LGKNGVPDAQVWALTATADSAGVATRARLSVEFDSWIRAGGRGVPLTTCHRAELYGLGVAPDLGGHGLLAGRDAVEHLLRVAAGLESVIVGEDDVLHQVREALRSAQSTPTTDTRLSRLFEVAVATGRRARSRRTEASGNLAQKAVAWLASRVDLAGAVVVVGGAGRMGAALAHALRSERAQVVIASRDAGRASRLARAYGGDGVDLSAGANAVRGAAAVAVALAGPWPQLASVSLDVIPPVADISSPQSVPEAVRRRLNGDFLGIDALYRRPRSVPGAYTAQAVHLVALKTDEYVAWLDRTQ
jgi:glutamyl-tRNA reductase